MAIDYAKSKYILGECKYKKSAFAITDFHHMKEKFKPNKEEDVIYYWIFSKGGYTEEVIQMAQDENVQLVTLEDIVLENQN